MYLEEQSPKFFNPREICILAYAIFLKLLINKYNYIQDERID